MILLIFSNTIWAQLVVIPSYQGNVSCFGGSNGSAYVQVTGGVEPYTYSWSPVGGTNSFATGLSAGSYTVTVKDFNNNIKTQDFTITQPAPIDITVTGNEVACNNTSATLEAFGAEQYFWYKQLTDTSPVHTGDKYTTPLLTTNTTFFVQGAKLSPQETLLASNTGGNNHRGNMIDVTATNDLVISSFDVSPMGNTTIEVYFKEGTFTGFENNPEAWTFLGSAPVVYTGSFVNAVVGDLHIPAGKTYGLYITSNSTSIALNYSNSVEGATYWNNDMEIKIGVGLEYPFTAGTGAVYNPRAWNGRINYKLVDCVGEKEPVLINVPSQLTATISKTNATCTIDNGTASVEVTGGSAPYTYLWSPSGGTGSTETNLAAGEYSVKITDSKGCFITEEFTILSQDNPVSSPAIRLSFNSGQSLSIFNVMGQGIKWYASEYDAVNHINSIASSTLIVNNTTYYATQTVDGCESKTALAINAYNETLNVSDVNKNSQITLYPNPVKDVLNLTSDNKIDKVVISDYSGRKLLEKSLNGSKTVDVQLLVKGTYLIQIFTTKGTETVKFIKD